MITMENLMDKTGLTRTAVMHRIKALDENGQSISEEYRRGRKGAVRVYTEDDLQAVINYRALKPGRKRKDG